MAIRRKSKWYFAMLGNYFMLIGFILLLRHLYGMDLQLKFYGIMTIVISCLLAVFSFVEPRHFEKVLPKGSTASLLVVLTLRFLPLMKRRVENIKHTQEMRGAKFTGFNQIRNYLSLFVPSILGSMIWIGRLTDGLRIRGEK